MSAMSEEEAQVQARPADHLLARRDKLAALEQAGEEAFKVGFDRTHSTAEILQLCAGLAPGEQSELEASVGGRLMGFRRQGKLVFADLADASGRIQLLFQKNRLGERFDALELLDVGDWVGVRGVVLNTKRGEISVAVEGFEILSKALRPLPEKWHGLKDVEGRYRQRYLDLIANPQARDVLLARSNALAAIRSTLMDQGFLEVETPMLQPVYGGALARPFVTYHEQLNMDLYLRVAPELYLKRLIVGGIERVFEINRSFRNEGVSVRHNPEFTMLELYQAFADYHTMAEILEKLVSEAAMRAHGSYKLTFQGEVLDVTPPFRRARMIDLVSEAGVDVAGDLAAECERLGVAHDPRWPWGKLLVELYEKRVERNLIQPVFVLDYPTEVSPLARRHRQDGRFTEHLDMVIAGMEVGVAYSELTDPVDQRRRFEAQLDNQDDESHVLDEDFLKALEHGMPPTGGLGMGIDRLMMLLTDQASIRDVILFPALKPEATEERADRWRPGDSDSVDPDPTQIPELLIVGTGKVASALVGLAAAAGFHVRVAAGPQPPKVGEFDGADEVIVTPETDDIEALRPGPNTYVAICSEVHEFAREVLHTLMPAPVPYIGLMSHRKRAAAIVAKLRRMGYSEEAVARVHVPIGLKLGARSPEEIALSILAEMVTVRSNAGRPRG
ncbi:MAG: lysine--tRNA ligase [Actinomycetota bacterium]